MDSVLTDKRILMPSVLEHFTDRIRFILNTYNSLMRYYNIENEQIYKIDDNYYLYINQIIQALNALGMDLVHYKLDIREQQNVGKSEQISTRSND